MNARLKAIVIGIAGAVLILFMLAGVCVVRIVTGDPDAVARTSVKAIPEAAQFMAMYPGADQWISYYTGRYAPPTLNCEVGLHGRFVLTMQTTIEMDRWRSRIVRATGPVSYFLTEIESVQQLPTGQAVIQHGPGVEFEEASWLKLVAQNGDLTALGIDADEDHPVPGFERALSRPR